MDEQLERLDHPGRRVWATAGIAILALGVVGAAASWATYRSERDAAVDEVEQIAVESLVDATQYADGRIDVLRTVAASASVVDADPSAIGEQLGDVPAEVLGFDGGLAWYGDHGTAFVGSEPWSGDPDVLATVAGVRAGGNPLVSPAVPAPAAPDAAVVVVVPTFGADGAANGALAGGMSVAGLRRVTANVSTLRDADVFLVDRSGRTIGGPSDAELGDVADPELARDLRIPRGGSIASVSSASAGDPSGRSHRVVGVAAEPELTGWTIVASRSPDAAFADGRRQVVLLLVAIVALATVGGACAWAVGRRLDRSAARLSAALARERSVALELQHQLLPATLPRIEGLELSARYEPGGDMTAVGGDWYDVVVDATGRTCLFIGDVAGHGIHAAGVMGQMQAALRALAARGTTLVDVVEGLDRFVADLPDREIATLAVVAVDIDDDEIVLGRLGHLPPMRITSAGRADMLWGDSSPPVGVPARRTTSRHRFGPGDTILLYTDGLIERRDRSLDAQLELLRATCERLAARSTTELVDRIVDVFGTSDDDVAVLAARRSTADRVVR